MAEPIANDKPAKDQEDEQLEDEQQVEETPEEQEIEQNEEEANDDGTSDGEDEESEPEKPKVSRRKAERLEKLIAKLSATQQPGSPTATGIDYKSTLDTDDETISKLETDRQKVAEISYREGLAEARSMQFFTRLEIDAPRMADRYPQLDPDSQEFNPQIADAINKWYLANVGFDPKTNRVQNADVRYADFVEGVMDLAEGLGDRRVASSQKNITKQAARTGLRPDGSKPKTLNLNKAPSQMTDAELDAVLNRAFPGKK